MIKQTYSYVVLELSAAAFQEIKSKLKEANYDHCFLDQDDEELITMQGIAVKEVEQIPGEDAENLIL